MVKSNIQILIMLCITGIVLTACNQSNPVMGTAFCGNNFGPVTVLNSDRCNEACKTSGAVGTCGGTGDAIGSMYCGNNGEAECVCKKSCTTNSDCTTSDKICSNHTCQFISCPAKCNKEGYTLSVSCETTNGVCECIR
jgi:hypothetical protein